MTTGSGESLTTAPAELEPLMRRYQQGDPHSTAALIRLISPKLHRYFMLQMTSRGYADDLLQETWLRIHQARHTYRPGDPVLPWVYAIARHVRVDGYRKRIRIDRREQQIHAISEMKTPASRTASSAIDVESLLQSLPAGQREVVTLLKFSGMTLEEVAKATSSSVGSVKQKAFRAYEKLRKAVARIGHPHET